MWFITKASKGESNKKPSNWITNLGLRHKKTWVGWLTTSPLGIGKRWLKEQANNICGCQWLIKLGHLNTTCGNWPHDNKNHYQKVSSSSQQSKNISSSLEFFIKPMLVWNWKLQGSRFPNCKPHLRFFKNLLEVENWSIDDLRLDGSLGVVMLQSTTPIVIELLY